MEIQSVPAFLDYWQKIRARTKAVIVCIPEDRYDWSHRPGAWTFADIIRHLGAIERYMFAENAQKNPSRYPGHGPELARSPAEVRDYLDRMHREAIAIFAQLTPQDLGNRCTTPGGVTITTWKWLRAMVEHEVHHRGQIYLMLGMLEIATPPLYGLTEEQVRDRSRAAR